MHAQAGPGEIRQGVADDGRARVRAADADIDHIGDALAAVAEPFAVVHGGDEALHARQGLGHLREAALRHRLAQGDSAAPAGARRYRCSSPGEHGVDGAWQIAFPGQVQQQRQRRFVQVIFGVIERSTGGFQGVMIEAVAGIQKEAVEAGVGLLKLVSLLAKGAPGG
ncbi:MAG: hypothetical protein U5K56_19240 [Halioglobus sp.]|nr:hypothetical protein [Halioglobus sp.]